jgi:serine/threonine-protein kinase
VTGTLPSGGRDPREAEPQYDFVKKLGAGGMALVFLARKRLPGGKFREVAFKQILPQFTDDPDRVDKFLDEMAVAASLHHPHIVGVHHWGTYEGTYFLELELVRGLTLLELLKLAAAPPAKPGEERYGRLPPVLVALLGAQLADALDYAHNVQAHGVAGYLHRDISPDNIMIVADRGVAKILDYGISKALKGADRQASKTQSAAGKPYYHPPEQWKGDGMDPRTDLYALGTTLSLALCGRQLFERTKNDTFEFVVVKVIQGERPSVAELAPPDAPPALVALLERLVQADKTQRPATAKEVGRAFRAIVRDLATDLDAAREQLATLVTAHFD